MTKRYITDRGAYKSLLMAKITTENEREGLCTSFCWRISGWLRERGCKKSSNERRKGGEGIMESRWDSEPFNKGTNAYIGLMRPEEETRTNTHVHIWSCQQPSGSPITFGIPTDYDDHNYNNNMVMVVTKIIVSDNYNYNSHYCSNSHNFPNLSVITSYWNSYGTFVDTQKI